MRDDQARSRTQCLDTGPATRDEGRPPVAAPPLAPNPLREGMRTERTPDPCVMVIFGATGDLTRRKLLPALYNLALEHLLPVGFSVIGFSRPDQGTAAGTGDVSGAFCERMRAAVDQFSRRRPLEPSVWDAFAKNLQLVPGDFTDPAAYRSLR